MTAKKPRPPRICAECGTEFTPPRPDRIPVVCSHACGARRHDKWQESKGRSGWARLAKAREAGLR